MKETGSNRALYYSAGKIDLRTCPRFLFFRALKRKRKIFSFKREKDRGGKNERRRNYKILRFSAYTLGMNPVKSRSP